MVGDCFGKNGYGSLMQRKVMVVLVLAVLVLVLWGCNRSGGETEKVVVDRLCLDLAVKDGNGVAYDENNDGNADPQGATTVLLWSDGTFSVPSLPSMLFYDNPDRDDPASSFYTYDIDRIGCNPQSP